MILFGDETIITELPPLRAMWSPRGQIPTIPISGLHARRVLYGFLSLPAGSLLLHGAQRWNQSIFQQVVRQVRGRWRGWHLVLFLDRGTPHRTPVTRALYRQLGIQVRWLPVACPELNPVDHLWRHVKNEVLANEPLPNVDQALERAQRYLLSLSPQERLRKAGVLSHEFWLRKVFEK